MKVIAFLKSIPGKIWGVLLLITALTVALACVQGPSDLSGSPGSSGSSGSSGSLGLFGKKLAAPIDLSTYTAQPQYPVQELRAWGQGQVRVSDEPLDMGGYRIYMYKLDTQVLEQYIAMLQQNGFTLVDEYHQSSFLGSYQAYGLRCDAAADVPTQEMMYTDTPCHINIWKADYKWRVEISDGLTMFDLGLRQDGSRAEILPRGQSLGAGLKRASGDAYQTDDGRLKTKLAQAAVLVDGQAIAGQATWKRSGSRVYVTVEISDGLSVELMYNEEEAKQGDVYLLCTLEEQPVSVTVMAGDEKITAKPTGELYFYSIALRIMYLEEKGAAVLYLYAEPMDPERFPQSIELLCAVNTKPEEKEESGGGGGSGGYPWEDDEPYQPEFSKQDCLTCGGDGDCNTCGGYGEVERYAGGGDTVTSKCSSCYGSGNCRTCGGSGKR